MVMLALALLLGRSVPMYADAHNVQAVQQSVSVKGQVLEPNGYPVVGATVLEKGTTNGVTTDIDGNFTLKVSSRNAVIVVSYIGFKSVELSASDKDLSKIVLKEDSEVLDEVVVVGYGTQKKATLTGSIEQVSSKVLESRAVTNVGLALQGQTPGLTVTRSSSRPGNEKVSFQIRGITSVNGGSPLIVIDGVPALNDVSFQNMNPDDIESISVLKDGSASIYGAKAANGVILVTTKKGKGKANVEYNFNMRFTTPGITAYAANMSEYATVWLESNKEEPRVQDWWAWNSKENMLRMQQGIEDIYTTGYGNIFLGNASRIDEMFSTRYSYQHNLSVSGSTDKSDYRISLAYADNQGNLATAYDGQKQLNLRLNYGVKLTDWFRLETSASMVNTNTEAPSTGLDGTLYGYDAPLFPAKNPYGQWYANLGMVGDRQAVAASADGGRDKRTNLTTRVDVKAIIDIWKGISLEGMASFQNEEYRKERYVVPVQTYDWFGNPAEKIVSSTQTSLDETDATKSNPGYSSEANNKLYQYYSALLKYTKTFADIHNLSATAGINAEKWEQKKLAGARLNFVDDGVYDLDLGTDTKGNSGGKSHNGTYSFIAKLNYNYDEKYLLELIGRRDGNSKFAEGHRFKNFGSFSLGWVFTQENFMKFITPVLDFGKVRVSYGSSGNDVGLGDYDYVSTIDQDVTYLGYPAGGLVSSNLTNAGLISYTRTWEKVEQKNIGTDFAFLNNRLTATFDYFIKDNVGMLTNVTYPSILGGSAPRTNSGHLNIKGWEVSLGWRDNIKDFSYFVNLNLSDNKTMLKNMEGADSYSAGKNKTVNGYPLNSYFLYRTDGFFKNQEEVDLYYELYKNGGGDITSDVAQGAKTELRPGDTKRVDLNGDYKVTDKGVGDSDLQYLGDANPHLTFGITAGGSWKGFDLNVFFQGVGKQYIMRSGYLAFPFATTFSNQNASFLGQTWTEDNQGAKYPRLTVYPQRAKWNYQNNDFMLQNSRYIRLKSLVIGYTLPKLLTQKVKLEKVRVFFSGNDLWEATSIKDGYDPEMGEASMDSGYPFCRTWSFGVNVGF